METAVCGFAAVNGGKHCVIGTHCVVCRAPATIEFKKGEEITLADLGPLNGTWRIVGLFDGTLKLEFVK